MSDNDNDRGLGFALALVLLVLLVLLVSQAGTAVSNSFNTTVYCLGYCSW